MTTAKIPPSFAEFLRIEEEQLAAQLRAVRAAITHSGEKGRGLEQQAIALLRRFLPAEYGLATGFIACAAKSGDGFAVGISPQIDIIIYDAVRGGSLMDLGSCQVFPLESVFGTVEVKATLYDELPGMYKHSASVRSMQTRHYVIHPNVQVDPLAQYTSKVRALAGMGPDPVYEAIATGSMMQHFPAPSSVTISDWLRVRSFAIAFEYDRQQAFKADAARNRIEGCFTDPGHFHGILVPGTCMAWNANASVDAAMKGKAAIDTKDTLAKFRHRMLNALASFPRPAGNMSLDLRPYFGGAVEVGP